MKNSEGTTSFIFLENARKNEEITSPFTIFYSIIQVFFLLFC
jgi:hypothetical protein